MTGLTSVAGDMAGAQAQVLLAAQMSLWARVRGARVRDIESALWKDRSLVRAWAMRRTMFLLPSDELAVFVRGTTRRATYHFQSALRRIGSKEKLDKLLDCVMEILREPRSKVELGQMLGRFHGYKLKSRPGGGWGNKSLVPWLDVGKASLPVGWLLHVIAARDVLCSGPNVGAESTFVRADRWISGWKDVPVEKAEEELLVKYLRAFGPATLQDFALWAGMYIRDAMQIWARETENMAQVDVDGWKASILRSDLGELREAEVDGPIVRFLPYFDSFLLGHKSHVNVVDEKNRKKVYRSQGWVSPVLLVDGRAYGVWNHEQKGSDLQVRITPFSKLPARVASLAREEASGLGRFLECTNTATAVE